MSSRLRGLLVGAALLLLLGGAVAIVSLRAPPSGLEDADRAWRAVLLMPRSQHAWASLGDALAAIDDEGAAEGAYRTALGLGPGSPELLGRLGFLLYQTGQDREALHYLQAAQRGGAALPMLAHCIEEISARLPPPPPPAKALAAAAASGPPKDSESDPAPAASPPGPCSFAVERGHLGTFVLTVQLNGQPVQMIVDTGASISALSAATAESLGIGIDPDAKIHTFTAAGPLEMPTAHVARLELGPLHSENLRVAVCNDCAGPKVAGLLGLDVLVALGLELDIAAHQLRRISCKGQGTESMP